MSVRLAALAELVGGELTGDGQLEIQGAATIRDARPGEITLADDIGYLEPLRGCAATAAVVSPDVRQSDVPGPISLITVPNARQAFATIVKMFGPQRETSCAGISPAATISPTASIASDVTILPGCFVGDDVVIESGCIIHANVTIMAGSRIGPNCTLFPAAVLYEETQLGQGVIVHAHAVLGAYGFGYEMQQGRHVLSAQLGKVVIGDFVEIGAGTTIDRGTFGATTIGEGTKIDNQVMIGHNCRIGRHNLLCAHVGIAGSCTTGDYVVMAGQVGLRDHVDIADQVMIGAQSGVSESLTEAGKYLGSPAVPLRQEIQCLMARQKLPELRKEVRRLEKQLAEMSNKLERTAAQPPSPSAVGDQSDAA